MVRIFLTGYMGAGKTTLGKAFARQMNIPFIDLDWYIEMCIRDRDMLIRKLKEKGYAFMTYSEFAQIKLAELNKPDEK